MPQPASPRAPTQAAHRAASLAAAADLLLQKGLLLPHHRQHGAQVLCRKGGALRQVRQPPAVAALRGPALAWAPGGGGGGGGGGGEPVEGCKQPRTPLPPASALLIHIADCTQDSMQAIDLQHTTQGSSPGTRSHLSDSTPDSESRRSSEEARLPRPPRPPAASEPPGPPDAGVWPRGKKGSAAWVLLSAARSLQGAGDRRGRGQHSMCVGKGLG